MFSHEPPSVRNCQHVQRHRTNYSPRKVRCPLFSQLVYTHCTVSGTSGYVQRNLSALRVHEKNNDKSSWDIAPPRHREPDEAILEHERKRKVEVKCLELRVELEDKELVFFDACSDFFLMDNYSAGSTKWKSNDALMNFVKNYLPT